MNMKVLKRSRRSPQQGDVFAYKMKDHPYGFGRVVRLETQIGRFKGAILIYIYDAFSQHKHAVPILNPRKLLIPPVGTNRRPWAMGYFETVEKRPLAKKDILPVHCFRDHYYGCYRNEYGNVLPRRLNPCGDFALDSFRTIDVQISMALGVDPAPDTVPPPSPPLDKIVAGVAREFDADASQWRRGGRGDIFARSVAAWLARYRFDYPVEAIAEALGYSGAGSARQAIRRIDRKREQLSSMLRKLGHKLSKSVTPQHRRKHRR